MKPGRDVMLSNTSEGVVPQHRGTMAPQILEYWSHKNWRNGPQRVLQPEMWIRVLCVWEYWDKHCCVGMRS